MYQITFQKLLDQEVTDISTAADDKGREPGRKFTETILLLK